MSVKPMWGTIQDPQLPGCYVIEGRLDAYIRIEANTAERLVADFASDAEISDWTSTIREHTAGLCSPLQLK